MTPTRRGFLIGFSGLLAAPAIVRAASLMPVSVFTLNHDEMVAKLLGRLAGRSQPIWDYERMPGGYVRTLRESDRAIFPPNALLAGGPSARYA